MKSALQRLRMFVMQFGRVVSSTRSRELAEAVT
jgi:hypothetical protein